MITDEELARLKEAAEAAIRYRTMETFYEYANPATIISLIEQLAKFKEQLNLLDDPDGFYTEARNQIRDSALEDAAKVAKDRADNAKVAYNCTEESRYLTDYQEAMGIYRVIAALKSATVEGEK